MHENREISSAPWFCDQGRSEKAINRNADMHVLEKSDCAIVPVNQPNNEGKPSAEVGEGRAQLEENIVQAHMLLTLSREMHAPAFGGVREVARNLGSLSRHPSFRRAVCVDALARICAGGDQRWSSLPRHESTIFAYRVDKPVNRVTRRQIAPKFTRLVKEPAPVVPFPNACLRLPRVRHDPAC